MCFCIGADFAATSLTNKRKSRIKMALQSGAVMLAHMQFCLDVSFPCCPPQLEPTPKHHDNVKLRDGLTNCINTGACKCNQLCKCQLATAVHAILRRSCILGAWSKTGISKSSSDTHLLSIQSSSTDLTL